MSILLKQGVPNSTKILLGALSIVSLLILLIKLKGKKADPDLSLHRILVPVLQLIPRTTITHPWVLASAIFAEISIIAFILSAAVLFFASKYVERFWGARETVLYVLIVGSITNLWTVIITIVTNIVKGDSASMDQPLGGGISYYFGFLVVFKQLIPEHQVILFKGLLNFRIKHLPFIFLCCVSLWSLFISRSLYPVVPSFGSFLTSYLYLRFYQVVSIDPLLPITTANGSSSESSLITGDASDAFSLVEFFPQKIHPFLAPCFNQVYQLGVLFGAVPSFDESAVAQSNLRAVKRSEQASQAQKNVANSVAERRRQVALQMIESRIQREPAS